MYRRYLALFFMPLMLASCATKVPVTTDYIRGRLGGIENATRGQYYVSKQITLTRVEGGTQATITDRGQIRTSTRTHTNRVIIGSDRKRGFGQSGIARSTLVRSGGGYQLNVAFENRDDNPALAFGQPAGSTSARYELLYTDPANNIVQYGNHRYRVSFTNKRHQGQPYLLIKQKGRERHTSSTRRARGLRVGN